MTGPRRRRCRLQSLRRLLLHLYLLLLLQQSLLPLAPSLPTPLSSPLALRRPRSTTLGSSRTTRHRGLQPRVQTHSELSDRPKIKMAVLSRSSVLSP